MTIRNAFLLGIVFIVTFAVSRALVQFVALQSFNVIEIEGQFAEGSKVYLSTSNGIYPINNDDTKSFFLHGSDIQSSHLQLSNRVIKRFRLDIQHQGQPFSVSRISLYSHFIKQPVQWDAQTISSSFQRQDYPDKNLTTLTLKGSTMSSNLFISWIIPLFLAVLVSVIAMQSNWREFPVFADLRSNQAGRNQQNLAALDGIRGLAALMVLLHHATMTFKGYGGMGVWVFFVLSGFLLCKPFVVNPQSSINPAVLAHFMSRRFKRIVPMFYFMVTATMLLQHHYESALRHYLFVQGDGHYWTILQEMYFYLLLPMLALGVYVLCRGRTLPAIIILAVIAVAWRYLGSEEVFSIYGLNEQQRGFFEVFIVGMIGAYWYHGIYARSDRLQELAIRYQPLLSTIGIIGLILMLEFCRHKNWVGVFYPNKTEPLLSAAICLALIILAVIGRPDCWYKRVLANPVLRYIGIIGYSFYLIHPYAVFITRRSLEHFLSVPVENVSEIWQTLPALALTTLFASFTYSFIERPFLQKTQRHARS